MSGHLFGLAFALNTNRDDPFDFLFSDVDFQYLVLQATWSCCSYSSVPMNVKVMFGYIQASKIQTANLSEQGLDVAIYMQITAAQCVRESSWKYRRVGRLALRGFLQPCITATTTLSCNLVCKFISYPVMWFHAGWTWMMCVAVIRAGQALCMYVCMITAAEVLNALSVRG